VPGTLLEEKTKPIEPIEVKGLVFKKMHLILTNRTHWNYLSCFQSARAKSGPIFVNLGWHAPGFCQKGRPPARPCLKTIQECPLESVFKLRLVLPRTRILAEGFLFRPKRRPIGPGHAGDPAQARPRRQSRNVSLFQEDGTRGLRHAPGFRASPRVSRSWNGIFARLEQPVTLPDESGARRRDR